VDDQTIKALVEEIAPVLTGRAMGKVFQLSRMSLAIDFHVRDSRYLFISVEPSRPGIYLIERRVRELEKQSLPLSPFALVLRKHLGGATLVSLTKDEDDRIVRLSFTARDEIGNTNTRTLVAQLTGKAANLLLLNEHDYIIDALRQPRGEGQEIGEHYQPPPAPRQRRDNAQPTTTLTRGQFDTLSEAADDYYRQLEAVRAFDARAANARSKLRREISQREKLQRHLADDLAAHGDALEHKRIGDLLLANIGSAERHGSIVKLTDYYADDAPTIELEIDEHATLQEEAARRFNRYTKARRAAQEIAARLKVIEKELGTLRSRQSELEAIINAGDEVALESFTGEAKPATHEAKARQKSSENIPGARRYRSSDGHEILVGRAARDNDHLTFRVARPHDLWVHAADYPGSHVIVRNPARGGEIPHRTIIEAAQLAAFFSQAKRDAKVDVHYTQRKFLSKPKGAAPGLVRMSSFRTLTVEPRESVERI
jgi:predicted ribosome quality control (RQC) complex YloA/Tae2 family protein